MKRKRKNTRVAIEARVSREIADSKIKTKEKKRE